MIRINRKGQGTTEYIVILAIIVGIAVLALNGGLSSAIKSKVSSIISDINK